MNMFLIFSVLNIAYGAKSVAKIDDDTGEIKSKNRNSIFRDSIKYSNASYPKITPQKSFLSETNSKTNIQPYNISEFMQLNQENLSSNKPESISSSANCTEFVSLYYTNHENNLKKENLEKNDFEKSQLPENDCLDNVKEKKGLCENKSDVSDLYLDLTNIKKDRDEIFNGVNLKVFRILDILDLDLLMLKTILKYPNPITSTPTSRNCPFSSKRQDYLAENVFQKNIVRNTNNYDENTIHTFIEHKPDYEFKKKCQNLLDNYKYGQSSNKGFVLLSEKEISKLNNLVEQIKDLRVSINNSNSTINSIEYIKTILSESLRTGNDKKFFDKLNKKCSSHIKKHEKLILSNDNKIFNYTCKTMEIERKGMSRYSKAIKEFLRNEQ